MRVSFRRTAKADIDSAFAWYAAQDPGVGSRFLSELEHVVHRMAERAQQFPVVHRDVRRALMKHFPYGIYFRVVDSMILVLAVQHQRQSPRSWQVRR